MMRYSDHDQYISNLIYFVYYNAIEAKPSPNFHFPALCFLDHNRFSGWVILLVGCKVLSVYETNKLCSNRTTYEKHIPKNKPHNTGD